MSRSGRVAVLITWLAVIGIPARSLAQNTGQILGRVTDATGAAIAGAHVTAQLQDKDLIRTAVSNTDGAFTLPALPIGIYTVAIAMPGFKRFENQNVTVDAEHNVRMDVSLVVGMVNQQITVNDAPPQVDTSSNTIGSLVPDELVKDLPLSGRNVVALTEMLPGVTNVSAPTLFTGDRSGPTLNASGARSSSNLLLLDGLMHNSLFRGTGQNYPPPDALAQVEFLGNQYPASYGHFDGAIVNVITRSGSNAIHGSLWEYVRNTAFNASNYYTRLTPYAHQNQFGAQVSGPILRNRLFYSASYEGIRISDQGTGSSAVPPTAAERAGNLTTDVPSGRSADSYLLNPNYPQNPNHDSLLRLLPAGCAADLGTGQYIRNATIPSSCLNVVSQNILTKYVPEPNNNKTLIQTYPNPSNANNGFGRLDLHFGRHTIDGRYYVLETQQLGYNTGANAVPLYEVLQDNARNQTISVNDTYVFSPQLLNVLRLGYNRMTLAQVPSDRTSLRDLESNFPQLGPGTLPAISVSSRISLATTSTNDQNDVNEDLDLVDSVTYAHQSHTLEFGSEYLRLQYLNRTWFLSQGFFSFDRTYTGDAMADYLFGFIRQITVESPQLEQSGIQSNLFLYAQDRWRILPRLTLNLGLRYELPYPWYQPQNYWGTFQPGAQSVKIPNAPRGLLYPGDPGIPRGIVPTPHRNFAPRFGFAYDPWGDGKTSIRGGFGIFYDAIDANIIQNMVQPFVYQFTLNNGPFGFSNPDLPPIPTSVNLQNPIFSGLPQLAYPNARLTTPYVESFNLGGQRQLLQNLVLDVEYVGKLGRHQLVPYSSNPAVYDPENKIDKHRIYPGFGNNTEYISAGTSNYNALQVQVTKRLGAYVSAHGAYTYSRSLDDFSSNVTDTAAAPQILNPNTGIFNLRTEYGPSTYNATHSASLGYTVYGPKFAGHGILLRHLAAGWSFSGIYAIRSGFPLNLTMGRSDIALSGTPNQRLNLISDPTLPSGRSRAEKIDHWFNNIGNGDCQVPGASFCIPSPGTFGNLSRDALVGPGQITNNMSAAKNFPIPGREGMHLQFRCDAFGVFNTPNLRDPGLTPGSTFGVITSTTGNRFLQLSLHLWF